MTQGSTNVILAWSSMIARPSIDMLVSGWLSITGHVLLKDLVRNSFDFKRFYIDLAGLPLISKEFRKEFN